MEFRGHNQDATASSLLIGRFLFGITSHYFSKDSISLSKTICIQLPDLVCSRTSSISSQRMYSNHNHIIKEEWCLFFLDDWCLHFNLFFKEIASSSSWRICTQTAISRLSKIFYSSFQKMTNIKLTSYGFHTHLLLRGFAIKLPASNFRRVLFLTELVRLIFHLTIFVLDL